jgi:putative Holliday junction resolvase
MTHQPCPVPALGVDLGTRRIGVAACDSGGTLAFPKATIERSDDPSADHQALAALLAQAGARTVVVGLPVSLDGTDGPAARRARAEAKELARELAEVEVVLFDERLTTVSARAALAATGRRGRQTRGGLDAAAAAVLLQAWLDAGRPRG